MSDIKKCTKCGKELPIDQFCVQKYKNGGAGYSSWCRDCKRLACTEWKKNNKERVKTSHAKWCKNNIDKCRAYDAKKRQNDPEKKRARDARWRQNNKEKQKERLAKWQKDNPEKCKIRNARWRENNPGYSAKYENKRRAADVVFKMIKNIRAAMRLAIINNVKSGHTIELLGCSVEYLHEYLEGQFKPGMTWDNWGIRGWHIDHIIPLSYFDMSDPEQQKRAWHYTNLRPLWAKDNLRKGNKIDERQLILL